MRILITGAGGAAAISVLKSLLKKTNEVNEPAHQLYMADIDPCAAGLYLVPAEKRLIIPAGDANGFVNTILALCQQFNIELVIPTVDVELIPCAKAEEAFIKANVKLALSPLQALEICYDKYTLLMHSQKLIPVPEFKLLNADTLLSVTTFPRFVKPRLGAGSRGALKINNANELLQLPVDDSYLIQEFLPGDEYSVDIFLDHAGNKIAAVPRLRMKIDSGIAVASRTEDLPVLAERALTIAKEIGIRYAANVQFRKSKEGEFKLLEINARFSGTLPLTTEAGVDIPELLILDIQNKTLPTALLPFKELMVVRYWQEHYLQVSEWEALCQKKKNC